MLPVLPWPRGVDLMLRAPRSDDWGVLSAGRGRPTRRPFGSLVRALPVMVAAKCGAFCVSLVGICICLRVGGMRYGPVKALFPEGRKRFELGSSGWSWVLGIDAAGGPPHCNFADEGGTRVTSRWCPRWRAVTVAGVVLDMVRQVGDQLESLCQIGPPDGMATERWGNAREPGQRTWVGRRELWEPPVEDGGHVARGREIATAGGFL